MNRIVFDKKIFNNGYAFAFTLLQYIFAIGFIFAVIIVILSASTNLQITIPDAVMPLFIAYIFGSIVVFPIVTVLKIGYKRSVAGSSITLEGTKIIYNKLADRSWTAVGHVEEHHIYSISQIDSVTKTRFNYIVRGKIEKETIYNGGKLESVAVDSVKIPNAYAGIEKLLYK